MNMKGFTGKNSIPIDFFTSAVFEGKYSSTKENLEWIRNQNENVHSDICQIPLNKLKG